MYTAAVLRQTSSHLLRWIAIALTDLNTKGYKFLTPQQEILPHHMTVNMGKLDKELNPDANLWDYVELKIDRLMINHTLGICVAPVRKARLETQGNFWTKIQTLNNQPHVTVALCNGVSPKISNDIWNHPDTEEVLLDQTYILEASLEEVARRKTYLN